MAFASRTSVGPVGELGPVDGDGPTLGEAHGDGLGRDRHGLVPVGDAHDRRHEVHRLVEGLQQLGLVRRAPEVGVGGVRPLLAVAVGEAPVEEELAHLRPPAELRHERLVQPRLVDPQPRVDQQPVAVEALDVVALVGRAVTPDVHAVLGHGPHQQRAGHRPAERRRVEVGAAGGRDVEGAALQGDEALVGELLRAVDQAGALGAVAPGPVGHGVELRLVVLAQVGRVGVGDGALLAHPGDRHRGVEAAGEGDADLLADGQAGQHVRHGSEP